MSSVSELACVYSALILHDDDVTITGDKLQSLLKAANVEVEPFWPNMFAKALEGRNIGELLCNVGTPGAGGGAPGAGGGAAAGGGADAEEVKEEKKEEKKEESEESDDDMGFGLFD